MTYTLCPECGLTIHARSPYLIVDNCPRCLAQRHRVVPLQLNIATASSDASLPPRARDISRGREAGRRRGAAVAAVHEDAGDLPLAG